jgi:hypothetical protein
MQYTAMRAAFHHAVLTIASRLLLFESSQASRAATQQTAHGPRAFSQRHPFEADITSTQE